MTHTDLIARLRGEYRIPITDGLGAAAGEEPNNPFEFVRRFPATPIQIEAADALTAAQERIEVLEGVLRDVIEMWDWCSEDPYDRGYSPVSDAVYNARAALDTTDNT